MDKFAEYQISKKQSEKKTIIGGLLLILAVFLFISLMEIGMYFAIPIGFTGIVFLILGLSQFQKLNKTFKKEVITDLVSQLVDNGVFIPERGLSKVEVLSTEFLKRPDRFHTEDYLSGEMDGVRFESSDVKLEERHVQHTKNGTRTYYETYFLGRIFIFDFNKTFEGYLQVLERGRPYSRRKFEKVKLESIDFNKKFKTYTTNSHSAFYVLTPHFMEALMKFEQKNRGTIQFSFIDSKLYIGINNFKDTFELRMFSKLDESVMNEFKRDLLVIKEVITELKLNNNIFKKE
jgi:hypothetical protein